MFGPDLAAVNHRQCFLRQEPGPAAFEAPGAGGPTQASQNITQNGWGPHPKAGFSQALTLVGIRKR